MKYTCFILLMSLLLTITLQCHYSCLQCSSNSFSDCTACPNNQSLTYSITHQDEIEVGICTQVRPKSVNILGIAILCLTISSCVIFKGEKLFYFALMLQTLGLLYLFNSYWTLLLDYTLEAFSYFMIISYIMYPIKQNDQTFKSGAGYKSKIFLKSARLSNNLIILGSINLLILVLLILIPLYRYCRKYSPHRQVAGWKFDKAVQILNITYFFLIQETMATIFISLSSSSQISSIDIIITIFYLLSLLLYLFNQCKFPLPFFRNGYSQFFMFLQRAIGPLFLSFRNRVPWVFYIYMLPLVVFEAISTNENRDKGSINRLFFYKFGFLIISGATAVSLIVDITTSSADTAQVFGYIGFSAVVLFLCLYCMEIMISFKKQICVQGQETQNNMTEQNIQVVSQINKDLKIYPLHYKPRPLPALKSKKEKQSSSQVNQSLGHLDMNAISLNISSTTDQPNLVFNFPEEPNQPVQTKMNQKQTKIQSRKNQIQQQQFFLPAVQKYNREENPAYTNLRPAKKIKKQTDQENR